MPIIKINQQLKRLELSSFEIDNELTFNYFNNLPENERDNKLLRALYIGVLALMEDRLSSFLAKTSNELGTELESLKIIFDMKKELFYKSAIKGILAEEEIAEFLTSYFKDKNLKDKVYLTGNIAGALPRNKTGDIVCEINGNPETKIVIECKFDKQHKLGDIESHDIFTKKTDNAWNQLLESQVNREAQAGIIVFDISLIDNSILKIIDKVGYIHGIGFIAIIDSQKGDYSSLAIAYLLARDIAINSKTVDLDKQLLSVIIQRTIKDIREVLSIRSLVESNIRINKQILQQLDKGLLLIEFNQRYLSKFLKDGKLTTKDLLEFYQGEDVKTAHKVTEQQIDLMIEEIDKK